MLAAIIFVEAGVVLWPFLPGDSMLFVAGAVVALVGLNIACAGAAADGGGHHRQLGQLRGGALFRGPCVCQPESRIFRPVYLQRTREFYDKYGPMSIILGRFVPIVRTFVPFLAGVAPMRYSTFLFNNIIGGILWITSLVYAGYLFGNVPWVKSNLSLIIVGILVISVLPIHQALAGTSSQQADTMNPLPLLAISL